MDLNLPVDWGVQVSWTVIWSASVIGLAIFVVPSVPFHNAASWLSFPIGLTLGFTIVAVSLALQRHIAAKRLAHAYVAAGLCPACVYDMSAAPPESDGCRVCPECGGAWRVERVEQSL